MSAATATATKYDTFKIDFLGYADKFAKWQHPKSEDAQDVCKYNVIATLANTALVSTIASLAMACFSNFIVLGIALTVASGLAYAGLAEVAGKGALVVKTPEGWTAALLEITGTPIKLFRCCPTPKVEKPEEQKGAQPAPEGQGFEPGECKREGRSERN